MPRQRGLFDRLGVHVCPDGLAPMLVAALECCLRDGGATLADDSENPAVTHVICDPTAHGRFTRGRDRRFFAIVRPAWVLRSFLAQKRLPTETFSADPTLFFSTLAIAAGSIDKDPRKVIDGLIAHFGGQIVDDASDAIGATHVLSADAGMQGQIADSATTVEALQATFSDADVRRSLTAWAQWLGDRPGSLDFALSACAVAFLGREAGLSTCHHVNYNWIEECVRRRERVAEGPFTHKDATAPPSSKANAKTTVAVEELALGAHASVYFNPRAAVFTSAAELSVAKKVSTERLAAMQETVAGAIVLIAQHIPPQLKEVMTELLKAAKAKVASVPLGDSYQDIVRKVVTNATFVVCRYQSGVEYEEALRHQKRIVSVYWVLAGLGVEGDDGAFRETVHRPVKAFGGISGMENFVITLSGYNSRTVPTREDVQMAIQATGACVLPVLSRSHSTHLLCYEAKGEKFKKAQSWNFENILSHEWLLECLRQWTYVSEVSFRMVPSAPPIAASSSSSLSAAVPTLTTSSSTTNTNTKADSPIAKHDEQDKENIDTNPSKPTSRTTRGTTTPKAKPSISAKNGARFDVDDLLDELDQRTPTSKHGETSRSNKKAGNDATTELFDTPSASSKRSIRKNSVPPTDEIPEDFEFQFGKKSKATDRHVMFEESEDKPTAVSETTAALQEAEQQAPNATILIAEDDDDERPGIVDKPKPAAKQTANSRKRKNPSATKSKASTDEVTRKEGGGATKKAKVKANATNAPSTSNGSANERRVFLLTGTREESAINESIIFAIGGEVSKTGRVYDPNCTHIICSELKRTEKFVAGCAAGKWILKPSYLTASQRAGHFVDEAPHEWGSKESDLEKMDPRIWPPAPAYWRKQRAAGKPGGLAGWRFFIHPKAVPPPDMCERILAASGGEVISLTKTVDLESIMKNATPQTPVLALVTVDLSSRDAWLKRFKAQAVPCINASFLIDYLTKDQSSPPRVGDYAL